MICVCVCVCVCVARAHKRERRAGEGGVLLFFVKISRLSEMTASVEK